jgi:IclR family acetate operon transcriptional repressor
MVQQKSDFTYSCVVRHSAAEGTPISVVGRTMSILTSFHEGETVISLSELSRRAGLPKSTTHRLLKELSTWGVVEFTSDGVALGMRMFELGNLVARQRDLRDVAEPTLNQLHRDTGLTVHMAILDDLEVVYIDKLSAVNAPPLPSRFGGRMPAYCTGVGKVLLAFADAETIERAAAARGRRRTPRSLVMSGMLFRELAAIRAERLAFDREESTVGVACMAVPIFDELGGAVAAISVSGWSSQMRMAPLARRLRLSASEIGDALRSPKVS